MSEERLQTFAYRVLRYTPNLVRDEWLNIGVLLHDPVTNTLRTRLIEEPHEFARVRRLHPTADETLLRVLHGDLMAQVSAQNGGAAAFLAKLDETLSNLLQLSPQKAVHAEDLDAELERLYEAHVAPPRYQARAAAELPDTRAAIRARTMQVFRRTGIYQRMQRSFSVESFTFKGDPLRIDFAYHANGTQGFVHSVPLGRDPRQAKEYAFTAERIRARLPQSEFCAITETEPKRENERHQFLVQLFAEQQIELVPALQLEDYAIRLRPRLQ